MGDFIRKNLEGIAEKICNINNKCLGITEDDLNPEIPLSNLEEWKKNKEIYNAYYFVATTASLTAFLGLYGGLKETLEISSEIGRNIENLSDIKYTGEMARDHISAFIYFTSSLVSASLTKKSLENIKKTEQKRKNTYSINSF